MEATRVGIREFRDNLANYVLESQAPVAITRHGDTVGYFIPAHRKRSDSERESLRAVAAQMRDLMSAKGIKESEIVADFKNWRKAKLK